MSVMRETECRGELSPRDQPDMLDAKGTFAVSSREL